MAGKLEHRGRDPKEDPDRLGEEEIQKDKLNGKECEPWLENETDGKLCVHPLHLTVQTKGWTS
jgi:hypothetical protein